MRHVPSLPILSPSLLVVTLEERALLHDVLESRSPQDPFPYDPELLAKSLRSQLRLYSPVDITDLGKKHGFPSGRVYIGSVFQNSVSSKSTT